MTTEIEQLLEQTSKPHVVIDADGRYCYANPAARVVIGGDPIGTQSPFDDARSQNYHGRQRQTRLGWTAVEFTTIPIESPDHKRFVVKFEVVHERSRRDRQLEAIVSVAAVLGKVEHLDTALDRLAYEVRTAMGFETCAVTLLGPDSRVRTAGTSGLPDNYAELLEQCRQLGAPLLTVRALEQDRVLVDPTWGEAVRTEDRWAPLQESVARLRTGTLIAAPLRVRNPTGPDDVQGALTVLCRADAVFDHDDLAFLRAMTDYAATAISNARMFRRLRQQAAHEERLRLSRELHDSVTQELFSLSLRTRALEKRVAANGDMGLAAEVGDLHDQSRRALDQMRALIVRGRAVEIGPDGLVNALRARCAELGKTAGIAIDVRCDGELIDLDAQVQEDVFLLAIEGVRNAIKHARASTIHVDLERPRHSGGSLEVMVSDDGIGIVQTRRRASAVGMDAMRERARAHGGVLTISSPPAGGTVIKATFPGLWNDEPSALLESSSMTGATS
jgi:signal transduction histidine kinase